MNLHLIQGEFSSQEALELLTQMINVKIKYHENKITTNTSEEDAKYRESKIKNLQKELSELRQIANSKNRNVKIESTIKIE